MTPAEQLIDKLNEKLIEKNNLIDGLQKQVEEISTLATENNRMADYFSNCAKEKEVLIGRLYEKINELALLLIEKDKVIAEPESNIFEFGEE